MSTIQKSANRQLHTTISSKYYKSVEKVIDALKKYEIGEFDIIPIKNNNDLNSDLDEKLLKRIAVSTIVELSMLSVEK